MLRRFLSVVVALSVLVLPGGCSPESRQGSAADDQAHADHAAESQVHSHAEAAPHGGHLIELGDCQFHAELVHDEPSDTVTVYLWDAEVREPVASEAPQVRLQLFVDGEFADYELSPSGEPASEGGATRFERADPALCKVLSQADQVRGRLSVTIGGKPYSGDVEHAAHDHDGTGHDHDADDHEHDESDGHDHDDDAHGSEDDHDHGE